MLKEQFCITFGVQPNLK